MCRSYPLSVALATNAAKTLLKYVNESSWWAHGPALVFLTILGMGECVCGIGICRGSGLVAVGIYERSGCRRVMCGCCGRG